MKEKAFGYIDEHRDGMMKMWEELVMMDSGSGNKPGVDAIVAKVAGILEGMGGKTRISRVLMPLWQRLPAFWKAWAAKPALLNTKMQVICW